MAARTDRWGSSTSMGTWDPNKPVIKDSIITNFTHGFYRSPTETEVRASASRHTPRRQPSGPPRLGVKAMGIPGGLVSMMMASSSVVLSMKPRGRMRGAAIPLLCYAKEKGIISLCTLNGRNSERRWKIKFNVGTRAQDLVKKRWTRFTRPYLGVTRIFAPWKWEWRDRILVGGEVLAFGAAIAAVPFEINKWNYAPWLIIGAAIIGTSALCWYAFDLISVGESPLTNKSVKISGQ